MLKPLALTGNETRLDVTVLVCTYTAAWIFLLLNFSGVYWDDWSLIDQTSDTIATTYKMNGSITGAHLHLLFLSISNGIWGYRLVTFVSYLLISILIYLILRNSEFIDRRGALFLSLIVGVMPVNQARVAMIITPSVFALAIFFLAFYLMVLGETKKNYLARIVSLCLYYFSFQVMSLLVFYAVPIIYVIYLSRYNIFCESVTEAFAGLVKWALKRLDYISLPFIFFYVKLNYFETSGPYAVYNEISLDTLLYFYRDATQHERVFNGAFYSHILKIKNELNVVVLFIFILSLAISAFYKLSPGKCKNCFNFFMVGIFMLILAIFPYLLVGHVPENNDWNSRHQLLTVFGGSVIIYAIINRVSRGALRFTLYSTVILMCVYIDQKDMLGYYKDAVKQESIIHQLSTNVEIGTKQNKIYLFEDKTTTSNPNNRFYRFYEYNGWMKKAYGNQTRLGLSDGSTENISEVVKYAKYPEYNFSGYKSKQNVIEGKITIIDGDIKNYTGLKILKLIAINSLDKNSYLSILNDYVKLSYEPIAK